MQQDDPIQTVDALYEKFGSLSDAAAFFGVSPQKAWNWRAAGRIPPQHYLIHREKLRKSRIRVDDALWFGPVQKAVTA